jgi:nucleoside-diphosphate-sugar epimerase
MKKAVVFGGAGFIGSHLLKSLAESGEYDLLVSGDIAAPRFRVPGVQYKGCDVRQPIPADICPGATEIYNLAAVHTTPGHEDWEYYWTNVLGAVHICAYARQSGVNTLVFTSSIAVYGPSETPKDEDSQLEPEIAYGKSKLCAEKIHRLWREERPGERKLVTVRPAVIYGYQEKGNFTRLAKLLSARRFVYPGRKDTIKSCGYVGDLVRSFRAMLERPEMEVTYNFAHQERYSSEDICDAFVQVAGFSPPKVVFPISLMLLVGLGFEILGKLGLKTSINRARIMKLNRSTNIVPRRLQEFGFSYAFNLEGSLKDWRKMSASGNFD